MSRIPLTGAERDIIVVLCETAIEERHIPKAFRQPPFDKFTPEDFERLDSIIEKLADDEPRETYTPQTGRL